MRYFTDTSRSLAEDALYYQVTPSYIEIELHFAALGWVDYYYLLPLPNSGFLVAACWAHYLDSWYAAFQDPKDGQHWFDVYCETWPMVGGFVRNGLTGRFADGALINVEDPDNGERVWVLATVVGNLPVTADTEDAEVLRSERLVDAYRLVGHGSHAGVAEVMATNDFSVRTKLKIFGRGYLQGTREVLDFAALWLPRLGGLPQ